MMQYILNSPLLSENILEFTYTHVLDLWRTSERDQCELFYVGFQFYIRFIPSRIVFCWT